MSEDFEDGIARLAAEAVGGTAAPAISGGCLSIDQIKTAEAVFQPRGDVGGFNSKAHVSELRAEIRTSSTGTLDPITVWWSGRNWYVVDGHHRLLAYKSEREAGSPAHVPVQPFEGTLHEASLRSAGENSKVKLPMTKRDKSNSAWKLVSGGGGHKVKQVTAATGVSLTTVKSMRGVHKRLASKGVAGLTGLSWSEAAALDAGRDLTKIKSDDEVHQQAKAWADRLYKEFGHAARDKPDLFAMALSYYGDNFIHRLAQTPEFLHPVEQARADEFDDDVNPDF